MSVKKTKVHGQWRFQVRYRDPDGIQRKQNFLSKRAAERFEDTQLTDVRKGSWINPHDGEVPLSIWANDWLENDPGKRDTSYARDEIIIRLHINPTLGSRPIASITPMDIQKLVNLWAMKYEASTVQRHYQCIAAIFNTAVNCDLLLKSPCRNVKRPKAKRKKAPLLSSAQLGRLVEELGPLGLMAEIGAILGLRWGEVAGLRVQDLDLLHKSIRVDVQVSRDKKGRPKVTDPKTDAGKRTLGITPDVVNKIAAHLMALGVSAQNPEAFLFADANGNELRYSNWRRRIWVPACERAELAGLGFHDLRRDNATAMVAERVDMKTAQTRLGHADPRMTLALYAQATAEGDSYAAEQLGARFLKANPA